jgi:hypothetical protein
MLTSLLRGAAAGAAGTTALNAVTYVDMVVRGRPASDTPERTVTELADRAEIDIPGQGAQRDNRVSGTGALLGIATGVGVGVAAGLARRLGWRPSVPVGAAVTGVAAMAGSAGPMASLGVSDPRSWSAADWISDALPHLAYGLVTTAALNAFPARR